MKQKAKMKSSKGTFTQGSGHTTASKYRVGDICWLKKKEDVDEQLLRSTQFRDGCYNHPAVILQSNPSRMEVCIFMITSLGGELLEDHFPSARSLHHRLKYMPIWPSPPHPDTGELLGLRGGGLRKKSYVNISVQYTCDVRLLYPQKDCSLDVRSLALIQLHALQGPVPGFEEETLIVDQGELLTGGQAYQASPYTSKKATAAAHACRGCIIDTRPEAYRDSLIPHNRAYKQNRRRERAYHTFNPPAAVQASHRRSQGGSRWFCNLLALVALAILCGLAYQGVIWLGALMSGWWNMVMEVLHKAGKAIVSTFTSVEVEFGRLVQFLKDLMSSILDS